MNLYRFGEVYIIATNPQDAYNRLRDAYAEDDGGTCGWQFLLLEAGFQPAPESEAEWMEFVHRISPNEIVDFTEYSLFAGAGYDPSKTPIQFSIPEGLEYEQLTLSATARAWVAFLPAWTVIDGRG